MVRQQGLMLKVLVLILVAGWPGAWAQEVLFDAPRHLGSYCLWPPPAGALGQGEKLVEVALEVSLVPNPMDRTKLQQVELRVESPWASWEVVDFFPRTITTTSLAGPVSVQVERNRDNQLGAKAQAAPLAGIAVQLNTAAGGKSQRRWSYQFLPPQETIVHAGTLNRRQAVLWRLKVHPQYPIWGTRQLVLVLRVPQAWRADWLQLHCRAWGESSGVWSPQEPILLTQQSFDIAVYLQGDAQAAEVARRFVEARVQCLRGIQKHRRWVAEQLGHPPLPSWLPWWPRREPSAQALLALAQKQWHDEFPAQAPKSLQRVWAQYQQATQALQSLTGQKADETLFP